MEKKIFLSFIEKYSLGTVESVVWEPVEGALNTKFVSDNKDVLGEVTYNGFNESCFYGQKIGLFRTSDFVRKLTVLQDNVDVSLQMVGDIPIAIKLSDNDGGKAHQTLSDLAIIKSVPPLKHVPTVFEVVIKINDKFANKYIKFKSALPDEKLFTTRVTDKTAEIIIGKTKGNSDRMILGDLEVENIEHIDDLQFNAELLKQIFSCNRGANGSFKISKEGLAVVEYTTDEYHAKYYLVAKRDEEE